MKRNLLPDLMYSKSGQGHNGSSNGGSTTVVDYSNPIEPVVYLTDINNNLYIIPRCMAGQKFNINTDKCDATGNSANNYGMLYAQWCSTNTNDCNRGMLNWLILHQSYLNGSYSEAHNYCWNLKYAGYTNYRVFHHDEYYHLYKNGIIDSVLYPNMISGDVWSGGHSIPGVYSVADKAVVYNVAAKTKRHDTKTTRYPFRCVKALNELLIP